MGNNREIIVNVSDKWCESLSKDEASLIVYELTKYRIRIQCGIENAKINGKEQQEKVNNIYGAIMVILDQTCDKVYKKITKIKTKELLKQLSDCINDVRDPNLKEEMTNLLIDLSNNINEMAERYWFLVKNKKNQKVPKAILTKNKIMFCKKCHKRVIKEVKSFHEMKNRCVCGNQYLVTVPQEGTELTGVKNVLSTQNRALNSYLKGKK